MKFNLTKVLKNPTVVLITIQNKKNSKDSICIFYDFILFLINYKNKLN